MQNLPSAETYDKEVQFMPWGILVDEIKQFVIASVPKGGTVLDLLCGTGNLLGQLFAMRPDIVYTGVDLDASFIDFAKEQHPHIECIAADALAWTSDKQYDAVLCTAGLHHLPYDKQGPFIKKLASLVKEGRCAIVADPYIDDYENETERKIAAAKLGFEYLAATIKNGAPDDVIRAASSLIDNDVFLVEYKNSLKKTRPHFDAAFKKVELHKTWPKEESGYGDYYFILRV